jgi:hypothetical protein
MRFLSIFIFLSFFGLSQSFQDVKLGFQVGVVLDFGSHENEIGLEINTFGLYKFAQLNAGTRFSFLLNSLGGRRNFLENRTNIGLLLLGGKRQTATDNYFAGLIHNSSYNNALGYNYIWYFDNVGTSQRSGAFGLTIKRTSIFFENDVFGGQAKDRFRTGHLQFSYRTDLVRYSLGINMWTGETSGSPRLKPNEHCPNGYKNLCNLPFGKTSHGVFYFGAQYQLPRFQTIHWKLGLDSEEIRHFFQNRLTHDLMFLPKSIPRNTPHYPRLDKNGHPVFDKNQRRNDGFYFQIGTNGNWSD